MKALIALAGSRAAAGSASADLVYVLQRYLTMIVAIGSVAGPCSADFIIDTYPDWDGHVTELWEKVAQSFTVPTGDNVLDNYMFALDPPGGQHTITFGIFKWSDFSGPVGDALYSVQKNWPDVGGDVKVDNIGLALPEGALYAAIVDLEGYNGPSVHYQRNQDSYSDGDASWFRYSTWYYLDSGWNTKFRARFIPTPGALAALGLLGLFGTRMRRSA